MQIRKSDFFDDGVEVDCTANPYDPSPAADAVTAEIIRIRQSSDKPIYVLSGEVHNLSSHVLLPFAFMLRNGLLSSTAPSALLSNFKFSVEYAHDALANFTKTHCAGRLSAKAMTTFVKADTHGQNLLSMLLTAGDKVYGPHAHHYLYAAMRQAKVQTVASDAALISDFLGIKYLNHEDEVAKKLVPDMAPHSLRSVKAFPIRNRITASLLCQQGRGAGQVTWHQAGACHLFGQQGGKYPYEASLSHQFAALVEDDKAHAILVFAHHKDSINAFTIPPQARRFPGHVIAVQGLHAHVPRSSVDDYAEAGRVANSILAASPAGSGSVPPLPYLTEYFVSQCFDQVIKDFRQQARSLRWASIVRPRKHPDPTRQSGPSGGL